MNDDRSAYIPVELAELLHVTLGPLGEVLSGEGHPWADMVKRVVAEYITGRDRSVFHLHGDNVLVDIAHFTSQAVNRVLALTDSAVHEAEHFLQWSDEVGGPAA